MDGEQRDRDGGRGEGVRCGGDACDGGVLLRLLRLRRKRKIGEKTSCGVLAGGCADGLGLGLGWQLPPLERGVEWIWR